VTIADITRGSVLAAIAECDRSGREAFRAWHGYRRSASFEIVHGRRRYDTKAILGVAYGYEHGCDPLDPSEFSGGVEHSARVLVGLRFTVAVGTERLRQRDVDLPSRLSLYPRRADLRLYVCRPTNSRSVAACREHNFGVLLSPLTVVHGEATDISACSHPIPGQPYVLDNGAWSCHVAGVPWAEGPFMKLVSRLGGDAGFAVAPDIVGGGAESLAFSLDWLAENRARAGVDRWMLAVQDGMTVDHVREVLIEHRFAGMFVGGSTEWKWRHVHEWSALGLELGLRVHVGRVNSRRRAELCRDVGVSSIDGSSVTRYAVNAPLLAGPCDGSEDAEAGPSRHSIAERQFRLTLGSPP
jgi:hypothetical protein